MPRERRDRADELYSSPVSALHVLSRFLACGCHIYHISHKNSKRLMRILGARFGFKKYSYFEGLLFCCRQLLKVEKIKTETKKLENQFQIYMKWNNRPHAFDNRLWTGQEFFLIYFLFIKIIKICELRSWLGHIAIDICVKCALLTRCTYLYSFDHQSHSTLCPVSTWMGNRLNDNYAGFC
jgi:hypothetical protein